MYIVGHVSGLCCVRDLHDAEERRFLVDVTYPARVGNLSYLRLLYSPP